MPKLRTTSPLKRPGSGLRRPVVGPMTGTKEPRQNGASLWRVRASRNKSRGGWGIGPPRAPAEQGVLFVLRIIRDAPWRSSPAGLGEDGRRGQTSPCPVPAVRAKQLVADRGPSRDRSGLRLLTNPFLSSP